MTLWNLGQVMSFATSAIGNRSDMAQSIVSVYANQAAIDINYAVEPQEMEALAVSSTTSGENKITLPSDFQALLALSNLSTSPYQLLIKKNYMDIDSTTTVVSAPQYYVLYDTWLELFPSPDSSYSLQMRYQARPSVLTLTTATPSFDTRFSIAWMYKTAAYCAWHLKDFETANIFDQKYIAELARIPSDLALRQRDRTGQNIKPQYNANPSWNRSMDFDNSSTWPATLYGP